MALYAPLSLAPDGCQFFLFGDNPPPHPFCPCLCLAIPRGAHPPIFWCGISLGISFALGILEDSPHLPSPWPRSEAFSLLRIVLLTSFVGRGIPSPSGWSSCFYFPPELCWSSGPQPPYHLPHPYPHCGCNWSCVLAYFKEAPSSLGVSGC